jgi:hypothetical protein
LLTLEFGMVTSHQVWAVNTIFAYIRIWNCHITPSVSCEHYICLHYNLGWWHHTNFVTKCELWTLYLLTLEYEMVTSHQAWAVNTIFAYIRIWNGDITPSSINHMPLWNHLDLRFIFCKPYKTKSFGLSCFGIPFHLKQI